MRKFAISHSTIAPSPSCSDVGKNVCGVGVKVGFFFLWRIGIRLKLGGNNSATTRCASLCEAQHEITIYPSLVELKQLCKDQICIIDVRRHHS